MVWLEQVIRKVESFIFSLKRKSRLWRDEVKTSKEQIILDSVNNDGCNKCKNKKERHKFEEDALCSVVTSIKDGLSVRCVGPWAYDKIYRLVQYFGIFSQGMYKKWGGINYIEICSGPGRCVIRESGEEINGTALAILKDPRFKYVEKAIFIDKKETVISTLNKRIEKLGLTAKASAEFGDYTDHVGLLDKLQCLPKKNLKLVFIDPTECNIPFKTIEAISKHLENVDFIINVTLGTDANRNLTPSVLDPSFVKVREKYESFLGNKDFFNNPEVIVAAKAGNYLELRKLFAETYRNELMKIGYSHIDTRPILHYYYLLFASKHKKGLDFWKKACTYSPDGQKTFNF